MEDTDPKQHLAKPNLVSISVRMPFELHAALSRYVNNQKLAARERKEKPRVTMDGEIQAAIRAHLKALGVEIQAPPLARQATADAEKSSTDATKALARGLRVHEKLTDSKKPQPKAG